MSAKREGVTVVEEADKARSLGGLALMARIRKHFEHLQKNALENCILAYFVQKTVINYSVTLNAAPNALMRQNCNHIDASPNKLLDIYKGRCRPHITSS